MFEQSFKRSHDSPIPRITLLNIIETSNRLSPILNTYDKIPSTKGYSLNFSRNWTLSPKKPLKKINKNRLKPTKLVFSDPNSSKIDSYLSKVLEEFHIKNVNFNEQKPSFKVRTKKNVFDKFFGENGHEEERKLLKYVNACDTTGLYS